MVLSDESGEPLNLVLYKFDRCPFCVFVKDAIGELGVKVEYRDTLRDPNARAELMRIGGKTQVPCLLINGKPLYESNEIIKYLRTNVQAQQARQL